MTPPKKPVKSERETPRFGAKIRGLRRRAGLTQAEVDLLRGVCKQILLAAEGRLPGRRKRQSP